MFRILLLFVLSINAFAADKVLIGICGGTGSGKTTLAQKLHKAFPQNSILISQDSYYRNYPNLSFDERSKFNFDHPNSLEFSLLREQLMALKENRSVDQPIYNFSIHARESRTNRIEPAQLIIVEGILLFAAEEVRDLFDLKIFVDTDSDTRVLRRIERDIKERGRDFAGVMEQYLTTVKPMHDAFVEPSKKYADIIVPEGGHNPSAVGLILSRLKEMAGGAVIVNN
jgi:uridine kinase